MSLADDVNLDEFVMTKVRWIQFAWRWVLLIWWQDDLSGADIKAICTESGLLVRVNLKVDNVNWATILQALRERRMKIMQADFRKAKEKVGNRFGPIVIWWRAQVMHKKKEGVPEGLYL